MYEKYSFVGEEETSVKTVKEALELSNNRECSTLKIKYGDIDVTDTGSIKLKSDEHQITRWGFEKFCGILGIPRPFARKIPEDLLNDNIKRLLKEKNQEDEVLFFDSKKGLLGASKGNNDPFSNIDFLTQIATIHSGKLDIHDIIVNDRGVTLNFFSPVIPNLEPKKGDITRVGFNTHNSDTGGLPTTSHLFLFRLECENGAVMKEVWGAAKRTYNRKITKETALANFAKQTEQISTNVELLTTCFNKMLDLKVVDEYFKRSWTSLKRVIGSEALVDETLEVSSEERKELFAGITKRKSANRKKLLDNLEPETPKELDRSFYELYNQITAQEKNYRLDDKVNIRKIGGEILYKVLKTEVSLN